MNTIYIILKQEVILEVTFPNPSLYDKETKTQRGDKFSQIIQWIRELGLDLGSTLGFMLFLLFHMVTHKQSLSLFCFVLFCYCFIISSIVISMELLSMP